MGGSSRAWRERQALGLNAANARRPASTEQVPRRSDVSLYRMQPILRRSVPCDANELALAAFGSILARHVCRAGFARVRSGVAQHAKPECVGDGRWALAAVRRRSLRSCRAFFDPLAARKRGAICVAFSRLDLRRDRLIAKPVPCAVFAYWRCVRRDANVHRADARALCAAVVPSRAARAVVVVCVASGTARSRGRQVREVRLLTGGPPTAGALSRVWECPG